MKRKAIGQLVIGGIFLIALNGCGGIDKNLGLLQTQSHRNVENNVFSSSFPEIRLQIHENLRYLGSVQIAENAGNRDSYNTNVAANAEATSYLFGQIDPNNRIARGVLIRMFVMHGDPSQAMPKIFEKTGKNILQSGEMKILEEKYQYDLYTEQNLFLQKERELLANRSASNCYLAKQLSIRAGLGNKSRVQVIYFEDTSGTCAGRSCGTCIDPGNRTDQQAKDIAGFTDRSFSSIRFLKSRSIQDATDRYVDAPARVAPSPAERVQPAPIAVPSAPPAESVKAGSAALEKRLEALKKIYEKNLISREDYEKKKAALLNEL